MSDRFTLRSLQATALWLFLAPLIVVLGTADLLTNGRSRSWPLGEKPREY